MAKELYSRLFDYIIDLLNMKLAGDLTELFISVLDIYGFEQFEHNRYVTKIPEPHISAWNSFVSIMPTKNFKNNSITTSLSPNRKNINGRVSHGSTFPLLTIWVSLITTFFHR